MQGSLVKVPVLCLRGAGAPAARHRTRRCPATVICQCLIWPAESRAQGAASSQQSTGQRAGMLTIVDHGDAIHEDGVDAYGLLMRIVECGGIDDSLRIEDDQISCVAHRDGAAIGQAECHRCAAGHLKHRLRQAEQTEIAGIMPEHPDDAPAGIPGDLRPGPDAERRGAGGYRRRQLRRRALLAGSLGGRYPKHVVLGWLYILRSVAFAAYFVAPPTASNTLLFAAVMGLLWFPGVWPSSAV